MGSFTPATRTAAKARIALTGPPGSGKTYTGLTFATALGDKLAVVDTEHGSAATYAGLNGWEFDTVAPASFSPDSLVGLLTEAGQGGYDTLMVDSLSHYWSGAGGMLEQVDQRTRGNSSFNTGWKDMRPVERRMIEALVAYPGHLIVTLRTKTEYVVEQDSRGKAVPRKVGLKPEQREGIEYEFGVVAELSQHNVLTVTKTRVPALAGQVIERPGPEVAQQVAEWYAGGAPAPSALELRAQALADAATFEEMRALHGEAKRYGLLGAAVTDAAGASTTLGELIVARGQAVRAAQEQGEGEAA